MPRAAAVPETGMHRPASASAFISIDKNSEKWAYVFQADLYNKLSDAKELTFGLPPSRLGRADASIALLSLLRHFGHQSASTHGAHCSLGL